MGFRSNCPLPQPHLRMQPCPHSCPLCICRCTVFTVSMTTATWAIANHIIALGPSPVCSLLCQLLSIWLLDPGENNLPEDSMKLPRWWQSIQETWDSGSLSKVIQYFNNHCSHIRSCKFPKCTAIFAQYIDLSLQNWLRWISSLAGEFAGGFLESMKSSCGRNKEI
jgi:hypothetical protein